MTGAPAPTPLLPPSLLARLDALQLGTRRRLAGRFPGEHRSRAYGSSLDFADYRQYHPGDDFRRVDYHLLARLDVALVKLFEAEEDVHLRLLVDTSGSMGSGGKLAQAARVAAALGFLAAVRRDPVTVHTFPLDVPAARFVGRSAVPALFACLAALQPAGETEFAAAVAHLLARPGPPGVTVVVSDLLTAEWERALTRLPSGGGDLAVVHVVADEDLHPGLFGDVELVDRETGGRVVVSLTPDALSDYGRLAAAWADQVAVRCHQVGAAYVQVPAGADLEPLLFGAWREAGLLR